MKKVGDEVFLFVERKIKWVTAISAGDNKAILAQLRHGCGRKPGDDPRLWGVIFEGMPEALMSKHQEPSAAEWAIYTVLTLYAIHQQGKDPVKENVNVSEIGIGHAIAGLVESEEDRERIERRLYILATASDMQGLTHYLRGIVQLLRNAEIGLDYALLAKDLYFYQNTDLVSSIRLRWGQDFYATLNQKNKEDNKDD